MTTSWHLYVFTPKQKKKHEKSIAAQVEIVKHYFTTA